MKDLNKLRKIFLADDIDEEDFEENKKRLNDWERDLRKNENFLEWQGHDITKEIIKKCKEAYLDNSIAQLRRELTETQRQSLWDKQDAIEWILSLASKDAKGAIKAIKSEVKNTLKRSEVL